MLNATVCKVRKKTTSRGNNPEANMKVSYMYLISLSETFIKIKFIISISTYMQ